MKHILVSWSTAYDNLLHFSGDFSEMDKEHILNMSIVSDSFEKNHGGTWANIAYNVSLLGEEPILLSSVGDDYDFSEVLKEKWNLQYVHRENYMHSANSVIISDKNDNRMTIFHPGAMKHASASKVSYVQEELGIAIVSANDIITMIEHARWLKEKKVPFFIDPAQQISQMTPDQLKTLIDLWDYLIANHYEYEEIKQKAAMSEEDILWEFEIVIITYWDQWSHLFTNGAMQHIPAIQTEDIDDTTWAWDAYRAWVLLGMIEWWDIKQSCQLWTVLSSYCIIAPWSQQHHFSLWGVMEDMKHHYWVEVDLYDKRKY